LIKNYQRSRQLNQSKLSKPSKETVKRNLLLKSKEQLSLILAAITRNESL
jgi:hypothetical protein